MSDGKLFVWRDEQVHTTTYLDNWRSRCPYCSASLDKEDPKIDLGSIDNDNDYWGFARCKLCGWAFLYRQVHEWFAFKKSIARTMRTFTINDSDAVLSEVGTHLKNNFNDIYMIDPRRFEKIVCDIFRQNGFTSVLTKQSRDRGVDVLVFDKDGALAVIECKRYARDRKVGIAIVQRLVGASVTWGSKEAKIITTSEFTQPARDEAKLATDNGYSLDLIDCGELLSALGVYNEDLPPLHAITEYARKGIMDEVKIAPTISPYSEMLNRLKGV